VEVIEASMNGLKCGKYDMIYLEYGEKIGEPTIVGSVDEARKKPELRTCMRVIWKLFSFSIGQKKG
jgi:hypothetical protein